MVTGGKELGVEGRFQAERRAHRVPDLVPGPRPWLPLTNNPIATHHPAGLTPKRGPVLAHLLNFSTERQSGNRVGREPVLGLWRQMGSDPGFVLCNGERFRARNWDSHATLRMCSKPLNCSL